MKKIFYLVGLILYLTVRLFAEVPQEFRAVKITNVDSQVLFSDAAIAEALDYLASININTVLLVVWNGSGVNGVHTLYPSAVMDSLFGRKIHPSFSGRDPLITVLVEAHARGIEVLPWFEYGFATYHNTTYQENPDYILKAKPHWGLRTVDGKLAWKNNFYWMSAINPEVQAMIHDLTLEVCKNYDIDGIEYSDRIPAMPVEGGYDSITVSIYKEEHGGVRPPNDYENATWKRWRADKMNAWLQTVRDSVKAYDAHFNFSSSPSIYPWCYHEYLQDPYTWMNEEICDDIIPQLYRYTYEEYLTVLDASLQNYPNHHHAYFAGILMNVGDYLISEDYLLRALKANRDRGVNGEAFFFYEGLRKNNNQLGTLLKNTYYANWASVPFREGQVRRPKVGIIHENSRAVTATEGWRTYTGNIPLHANQCFYAPVNVNDTLTYHADLPENAWYTVYMYVNKQPNATSKAKLLLSHRDGTDTLYLDQKNPNRTGWTDIATVYLQQGIRQPILRLVSEAPDGMYVFGDAVAVLINRHLSPQEDPVGITPDGIKTPIPQSHALLSTWPNPFNTHLTLQYTLPVSGYYTLTLHDLRGYEIQKIHEGFKEKGDYIQHLDCQTMSSGIYFITLKGKIFQKSQKILLLK